MGVEVKQTYGIKVTTILNATEKLTEDLEYLCSLVESPDVEFIIEDALAYAHALVAVSSHLDYITEDICSNPLTDDEEYVKLTEEEIKTLNDYTVQTEAAMAALEKTCGISLKNN